MKLDFILEQFLERRLDAPLIRVACLRLWSNGVVARLSPRYRAAVSVEDALWSDQPFSVRGGFYGKFLAVQVAGEAESAGAYISRAPGEVRKSILLHQKNIPPHSHEDSKISIVTRGEGCRLFVHRKGVEPGGDHTLEIPIEPFDIIALPAGTGHTYDAGAQGFSQIVITDRLRLPCHPAYAKDVGAYLPNMDELPRRLFVGTRPPSNQDL